MSTARHLPTLLLTAVAAFGCAGPRPRAFEGPGLPPGARVAILPLVNYTASGDAADRIAPAIANVLRARKGFEVVDPGLVDQALSQDPWLSAERMPPDVVDSVGVATHANALLVGSVLAFGYRTGESPPLPEVSISMKLLETPGGRCLWSAVHSRDGADRERLFGIGRIESLEKLVDETVVEILDTLPLGIRDAALPLSRSSSGGKGDTLRVPHASAVLTLVALAALARAGTKAPERAKAPPDSATRAAAVAASDTGPFRIRIGSRLYPDWSEDRVVGLDESFFLGDTDLKATVMRHFQDFKIKKGVPFDASKLPNNPALFILVTRDTAVVDSAWAFRNFPPHVSPKSFFTFRLLDAAAESTSSSSAAKGH